MTQQDRERAHHTSNAVRDVLQQAKRDRKYTGTLPAAGNALMRAIVDVCDRQFAAVRAEATAAERERAAKIADEVAAGGAAGTQWRLSALCVAARVRAEGKERTQPVCGPECRCDCHRGRACPVCRMASTAANSDTERIRAGEEA